MYNHTTFRLLQQLWPRPCYSRKACVLCNVSIIALSNLSSILNCGNMCWWFTDAEKMSLSHLTQKFFMLFLVAPVSLQCVTSGIAISHRGAYAPQPLLGHRNHWNPRRKFGWWKWKVQSGQTSLSIRQKNKIVVTQWRHSLLTRVDKVQGPQGPRGPQVLRVKNCVTKLSQTRYWHPIHWQ